MKDLMVMAFILSAPATSTAGIEGDCYHALAEASYKQSGIEKNVNRYIEHQLKFVPKEAQTIVGNSFLIAKMIQEGKVSYTWIY